jgi:hypothetical protein
MREIQNHPVKTALQSAVKALESTVASMKTHIAALKTNIIEGCKNAVAAYRDNGVKALDNVLSFFHIKPGLQAIKNNLVKSMGECDRSIAKINAFANEYHGAGRAVKNMFRIMIGKPALTTKKEAGRIARTLAAPYRFDKACFRAVRAVVDKAIGSMERLEQKSDQIRSGHTEMQTGSLAAALQEGRDKVEQRELTRKPQERLPHALGAEI